MVDKEYCYPDSEYSQAEELFNHLKNDNYLHDLDRPTFAKKLAYYFSEINALHPFREGNGRSQREFVRVLALSNHYKVTNLTDSWQTLPI